MIAAKIVWHMPARPRLARPPQAERLRRHSNDVRIKVQQHHRVAFHPGLKADMLARGREPPRTLETPLALERPEGPHRRDMLMEAYDGPQIVGMDLHRRRSVLVRMTEEAGSWLPRGSPTGRCG